MNKLIQKSTSRAFMYPLVCFLFLIKRNVIAKSMDNLLPMQEKECFRKPAPRPMPADDALPPLTLFIAAYNEEDVVYEKMHNCLELDYPADKLRILWVKHRRQASDGAQAYGNILLS